MTMDRQQAGKEPGPPSPGAGMDRRDFMRLAGIGLTAWLAFRARTAPASAAGGTAAAPLDSDGAAAFAKYLRTKWGVLDIRTVRQPAAGAGALDVVIVSAGFQAAQMGEFHQLCGQLAKTLLAVQPWQRYESLVNVRAVFLEDASPDATRMNVSGHKGEVLGCDDERAVTYSRLAAHSAATIVLHNSAFSTASNGTWSVVVLNRADVADPGSVVHELGHGFAGLGDEYIQREGPFNEPPESLAETVNVTPEPRPAHCKWHYWLPETWPGVLGAQSRPKGVKIANFEGAGWPTKIYRPEETCLMRGDRAEYCVVCSETVEANFFRYVNLFKTAEPTGEDLLLWKGETVDVRLAAIDLLQRPPSWLASRLTLYLDGAEVAASDQGRVSYRLKAAVLGAGVHQLGALLDIQSDTVRRDFGFLSDCRGWRVKVVPQARPEIRVRPLVTADSGEAIDVTVRIRHADAPGFEVKLTHAPEGAILEEGRFCWSPEGRTGSWRAELAVFYDGKVAASATLEIRVAQKGVVPAMPAVKALDPIEAVTGNEVQVQLEAAAKDGGHLLFELVQGPDQLQLDPNTGELSWVPRDDQGGPQVVRIRVRNGTTACETVVLFLVRWQPAPAPVSFCNDYTPQTVERLKELSENPALYRRLFETIRLLRDRYAAIRSAALAGAKALWPQLPPELQRNGLDELCRQAWSLADNPDIIAWLREVAVASKTASAGALQAKLDQVQRYNVSRGVACSP